MHRSRDLLAVSLFAIGACTTLSPALASATPAGAAAVPANTPLANGVTLIPGGFLPGRQPDGNTVVFEGSKGLVVLDSGRHPEHSQAILDFATRQKQSIVALVNSHWHLDHTSGNPRLRAAYPELTVYASCAIEGAMTGFLANSRKEAMEFLAQPGDPAQQAEVRLDLATIDSGKALYPDVQIRGDGERVLAGRKLHVGFEPYAVTAGDVWLYDQPTRILASGDLVTLPVPFFDTACPAHWQSALAKLDRVDFRTLVPGHGEPMTHAQFDAYRGAFDNLLACAASTADKKDCSAGWLGDAAQFLPTERDRKLAGSMMDYYMDAVLRAPREKLAPLCGDNAK